MQRIVEPPRRPWLPAAFFLSLAFAVTQTVTRLASEPSAEAAPDALSVDGDLPLGVERSSIYVVQPAPDSESAYADTLTIGNGGSTALFVGPVTYSRIVAPHAYRDPDGHCYSSNVLHVDGSRVPVECP